MPDDQPSSSAGDTGSSGATFRGGVERVDESTGGVPATPARPADRPADAPGVGERSPVGGQPTAAQPVAVAPPLTPELTGPERTGGSASRRPARGAKVRARKVRRVVRHIDPWSVLKISLLFYAALFLIVCVASALLWGVARAAGTVDNVESFITSVGGFGNCEPVDGASPTTTTTLPGATTTAPVDQLDPTGTDTTLPEEGGDVVSPGDDEDCREGEELVGEFRFEDGRIFQAFALGGIVLVIAGTAANLVLVLLFNLMSDLTGGVRVTVLEEEGPTRTRSGSGSPAGGRRG